MMHFLLKFASRKLIVVFLATYLLKTHFISEWIWAFITALAIVVLFLEKKYGLKDVFTNGENK